MAVRLGCASCMCLRTLNPEPGTRNPEPRTRNLEPERRNPEPGTRNPEHSPSAPIRAIGRFTPVRCGERPARRSSRTCRGRRRRAASTPSIERYRARASSSVRHVGRESSWRQSIAPMPMSPPTRFGLRRSRSAGVVMCLASTRSRNPGANRSICVSMQRQHVDRRRVRHVAVGPRGVAAGGRAGRIERASAARAARRGAR